MRQQSVDAFMKAYPDVTVTFVVTAQNQEHGQAAEAELSPPA